MSIIIFIIASLSLLTVAEFLRRKKIISINFSRRFSHIGAGVINIIAPLFITSSVIVIVNIMFIVFLIISRRINFLSSIQASDRKSYGDIYFPTGIIIAAMILLPENMSAFQYGVAVMGISDALAGYIGERWGVKKYSFFKSTKTVLGSVIFYFSTLLITFIFAPEIVLFVFLIPLLLTIVEFFISFGFDNLILPIVSGIFFMLFF